MKKTLLLAKMLFIVGMLCMGQSAWGSVTSVEQDYSSGEADWTSGNTGRYTVDMNEGGYLTVNAVGTGNNGTTITGSTVNGKAASGNDFESSDDFTMIFDLQLTGGNNQASFFHINDQENKGSNEAETGHMLALYQTASSSTTWRINGASDKTVTMAKNTWYTFQLSKKGSMLYLTVTPTAGGDPVFAQQQIPVISEKGGLGNMIFQTKRYYAFMAIDNVNLRAWQDGDTPAGVAATYTIKYQNEGGEQIANDVEGNGLVGDEVTASAAQMNPLMYNDKKYIYKSGNEKITLVETTASNVITLVYREAATYAYTVTSSLGETLASGSGFEGETVHVGYSHYQLSEGKLYEADVTDKEFRKKLVLTENNIKATVDYAEWNGSNPVVFCAEGENIDGMIEDVSGNISIRASNAKAGKAADDVTITTLPAGKYKLHVGAFTSRSSEQKIYVGYGETQYAFASSTNLNESASEEFTLTEETDIKYFGTTSSTNAQFDYIWIEKTGEYVPPIPTYTVSIAEGIENGTVSADPTSAKVGDEITLTNTPAEGFELVSYSVTGVHKDLAVTVTDGKFTMPDDDVTVNATFAKVYSIVYADGMVGGIVNGPVSATAGEKVTLTVSPEEGYELKTLKVTLAESENEINYDVKDFSFTMPEEGVKVFASFQQVAPVYAVTIADGIVGGTVVADPTSAKEGVEVTLINTPAEGYEFVGYSVTGVHEDLAVIVTNGKFNMPADDVTVNAEFKKKVVYIETDLTKDFISLISPTTWKSETPSGVGQAEWAAPKVTVADNKYFMIENYVGTQALKETTGGVMYNEITGLTPGLYTIELYGSAAVTVRDDITATFTEGDEASLNAVYLYAESNGEKVKKFIPCLIETNFNNRGGEESIPTATLDNVVVGNDGKIKIGIYKEVGLTNWHIIQLKSVTAKVLASDLLANAVAKAEAIKESEVPAEFYNGVQNAIAEYNKDYDTAEEYQTAIHTFNALVEMAEIFKPVAALLNEGESYKANIPEGDPAIATYDAAIAQVKHDFDYLLTETQKDVATVEAALPALAKAQTAPNSDMTRAIVNPTIDGVSGWTCNKPKGGGGPELPAGGALEYWAGSANPRTEAAFDYYQVIEGLTSGKYIVSAGMYNSLNDEAGAVFAPTSGVYASSGNDETAALVDVDGTEFIRYTTEPVFVKDGKLRLGVKNTETPMAARWFVADNFTLTLVEAIPTYAINVVQPENGTVEVSSAFAATGEEVTITATPAEGYELAGISVTGVHEDLAVIVTDGKFNMPSDDVTVNATFQKTALQEARENLQNAIADAKAIDTEFKEGAEELATAIATAERVCENVESTVNDLVNAKTNLEAAVEAFNAENAKYSLLTYIINGQSTIQTTIKKGKTALTFTPDEGWAISEVLVNEVSALSDVVDNKLSINVDADVTSVEVTFGWANADDMYTEDEATGIATIADEGIKVYAVGNQICVEGAAGKTVRLYSLYGSLIKSAVPSDNKVAKFAVNTGTYVVQVGKKAAKISVK